MSTDTLVSRFKSSIQMLLDADHLSTSEDLLTDESKVFEVIAAFQDARSSPLLRKLAFCNLILAIDVWKKQPGGRQLPELVVTTFQLKDGFLGLAYQHSQEAKNIFEGFKAELELKASDVNTIMLFVPIKFISQKRLYQLGLDAIRRIVQTQAWEKLLDPLVCLCWIKLPAAAKAILVKKSTLEIMDSANSDDRSSSLAKRLLTRNISIHKPNKSISSGETKDSIFKRNLALVSIHSRQQESSESEISSPLRNTALPYQKYSWNADGNRKAITCRTTQITAEPLSPSPTFVAKRAMTAVQSREELIVGWLAAEEKLESDQPRTITLPLPQDDRSDAGLKVQRYVTVRKSSILPPKK